MPFYNEPISGRQRTHDDVPLSFSNYAITQNGTEKFNISVVAINADTKDVKVFQQEFNIKRRADGDEWVMTLVGSMLVAPEASDESMVDCELIIDYDGVNALNIKVKGLVENTIDWYFQGTRLVINPDALALIS